MPCSLWAHILFASGVPLKLVCGGWLFVCARPVAVRANKKNSAIKGFMVLPKIVLDRKLRQGLS
jgi:hypothetical protein